MKYSDLEAAINNLRTLGEELYSLCPDVDQCKDCPYKKRTGCRLCSIKDEIDDNIRSMKLELDYAE